MKNLNYMKSSFQTKTRSKQRLVIFEIWLRIWIKYINPGVQPEISQGRRGFVKLWYSAKHFVINSRKTVTQGKMLKFFLLDTLKTAFWIVNLRQWWTRSRPFFLKTGHFFWCSKKGKGRPLPPPSLVVHLQSNRVKTS